MCIVMAKLNESEFLSANSPDLALSTNFEILIQQRPILIILKNLIYFEGVKKIEETFAYVEI